jgi:hypothetical protein
MHRILSSADHWAGVCPARWDSKNAKSLDDPQGWLRSYLEQRRWSVELPAQHQLDITYMPTEELSDSDKEFAKFLERDFTQCFEQMRHYDGQIIDICKFAFTAYATVFGAALALYRYGLDHNSNFRAPALAILIVGLLLGICLVALTVRSRVYFVVVTRYVNEHRSFFLERKPLGFQNRSHMYTNVNQPPFFNWRSSQELLLYTLIILNSGLMAAAIFMASSASTPHWSCTILLSAIFAFVQLGAAIGYLVSREGKKVSKAVFGADSTPSRPTAR